MIQRKQTLFLLELVFLGIALLFIPSNILIASERSVNVYLMPSDGSFTSTSWHYLVIATNLFCLILSVLTILLYKKRSVQVKLCYMILAAWAVQSLVIAFCPLALPVGETVEIKNSYVGVFIGLFAILAAFLAARFIKKDIELLKSADRIR